jgi:hypothetical protein
MQDSDIRMSKPALQHNKRVFSKERWCLEEGIPDVSGAPGPWALLPGQKSEVKAQLAKSSIEQAGPEIKPQQFAGRSPLD